MTRQRGRSPSQRLGSGAKRLVARLNHARALGDRDVCEPGAGGAVVSLTTFPPRILATVKVLRSILSGDAKPAAIMLTLSLKEFKPSDLPSSLLELQQRGVRLHFTPGNMRSYKKLLPALHNYPDRLIVTADDDVLYPPNWLSSLLSAVEARPEWIAGLRGSAITAENGIVKPYLEWPMAGISTPPEATLLKGICGIAYPVGSLPDISMDYRLARDLCGDADDIWFKAMSLLNATPTWKTIDGLSEFPSVLGSQKVGLFKKNVGRGLNDVALARVLTHFDLWSNLGLLKPRAPL